MHVFVTGGTGQTGPAIVSELLDHGHTVMGLARSDASAATLERLGATVLRGGLEDLDALTRGAGEADGVAHLAFGGEDPARHDTEAIDAFGGALAGTGKPLVITSGTLVLTPGRIGREDDTPDPESLGRFRIPGEQACLALAAKDVRASVVRLAPTVHGPRDHGFVPVLINGARRNGVAAYVGDGEQRWPTVDRLDAARLYRLALEHAPAGSVLHGVGEEAVTVRSIAEQVGESLGVPTAALTEEQMAEHLGSPFLARAFGTDAPASSERTQTLLDWTPTHPGLLDDLRTGDYFTPEAQQRTEARWS